MMATAAELINVCTLTSAGATSAADAVTSNVRSRQRILTEARREQNRKNQRTFRQKQREQRRQGLQHRFQHSWAKKLDLRPGPTCRRLEDRPIMLEPARTPEKTPTISAVEPELVQDERTPLDDVATPQTLLSLSPLDSNCTFTNGLQPFFDLDGITEFSSVPSSTTEPLFSSVDSSWTTTPLDSEFPCFAPHEDLTLHVPDSDETTPRSLEILDHRDLSGAAQDWSPAQDIPLFPADTRADVATTARPDDHHDHPNSQSQAMSSWSFNLENVIAAGLEVLLCGHRPSTTSQAISSPPRLPNPRMTGIQFYPNKIILACIQNALSMGFLAQDVLMPRCLAPSPFYRLITPADDPKKLLAAATRPSTPVHLRPTLPQLLYPHPAFMDLIPMPVFRARAITLAATQPHLFNIAELKKDMVVEDGLVLWSSVDSDRVSEGQGQPWDMRSWEAAPWFLRKWRMLVDGEDGEVWKQSLWWQRARGDAGDGVSHGI